MPAVTRIGDADVTHCSGMVRAQGYNRMIWDIESWNRQSLSTLEHTKGITTEEISYES